MNKKNEYQDEGLKGNERIEDAIFALQKEATQEQLAHTLTVIRRRMKEGGQLIVAVEPDPAQAQMKLQTVRTPDGKIWWSAFTSFEEELKGADQVKSTFLSEIGRMFEAALTVQRSRGLLSRTENFHIFRNYMQYDSKRTVILSGKQYVQTNEKKEKGISTETAKQLLLHERRNSRINIELTDPEADVTFSRMRQN